jgi:hypothetical protein
MVIKAGGALFFYLIATQITPLHIAKLFSKNLKVVKELSLIYSV